MKQFKYDVVELIKCVRDRPVIWDKTSEAYKDRLERKYAWDEIFRSLDEGFDEMTREKQRTTGEMVITKWTNMRDTFHKSIKNQNSKTGTRKYMFHDQMSFLLKVIPSDILPDPEPTDATLENNLNESDDDPISYNMGVMPIMKQEREIDGNEGTSTGFAEVKRQFKKSRSSRKYSETSSPERQVYPRKKRSKKEPDERRSKKNVVESPPVDFVEVNEVNDPRVMNEDEAFFASLLPTVVKYSEEERLEFRIEVLAVMKSINDKRRQRWTDETVN